MGKDIKEKQGRGQLTEYVQLIATRKFGYEISVTELRLMPYIMHVMMNSQKLDPNKINEEERKILSHWKMEGFVIGGASGMEITKDFWDILCEIVFAAYVDITE